MKGVVVIDFTYPGNARGGDKSGCNRIDVVEEVHGPQSRGSESACDQVGDWNDWWALKAGRGEGVAPLGIV